MTFYFVILSVPRFVSFNLVRYDTRYADKCIVNVKVYIKENNLHNGITFFYFIHVYFCEASDSMQYRPPNANQEFNVVIASPGDI